MEVRQPRTLVLSWDKLLSTVYTEWDHAWLGFCIKLHGCLTSFQSCFFHPLNSFLDTQSFFFFNFKWRLITILWWFLPYSHMNQPWLYVCSPSWPSLPPPPHPIPHGHPSATALSTLPHALNLDWWSISHMVIHIFQCYSLKSSHPFLLPPSPKVYSLHLCLFWCLTYRVIVTIFLKEINSF